MVSRESDHFPQHYHKSILDLLAEKNNPFHGTLGSHDVQQSLHHARIFHNKYRNHGANDLYKPPYVARNTRNIVRALRGTNDHVRDTIEEDRLESALGHLLEMRAENHGNQNQDSMLQPPTRFKARGLGLERALRAVNDLMTILKLDPKKYNSHGLLRRVLLEPSDSHLCILHKTLEDISIIFREEYTTGQNQLDLLTRFVATGLNERRRRSKTDLHKRTGELAAQFIDLLRPSIERISELETRTRLLRTGSARIQARLNLKTAEAFERIKQANSLRQVVKDLNSRLQEVSCNHIDDLSRRCGLQDQIARLRSQLEAERNSHKACKPRTVAMEARNKSHKKSSHQDACQKLEEERDPRKAAKEYVACAVDGHALLATRLSTMQEEMKILRAELGAEQSSRRAAECKARRFEDEVDSIRAGMESMLRRPRPDSTLTTHTTA